MAGIPLVFSPHPRNRSNVACASCACNTFFFKKKKDLKIPGSVAAVHVVERVLSEFNLAASDTQLRIAD
jgi:hypothetical protein